jgi:hypothetical protein
LKKVKIKWSEIAPDISDDEVDLILGNDDSYVCLASDESLVSFMEEHGIEPQSISGIPYAVAQIGFSDKEQKWYGWSHRAIYGFGMGDEITEDSIGFVPGTIEDALNAETRFWEARERCEVKSYLIEDEGSTFIKTEWMYSKHIPNEEMRGKINSVVTELKLGKGSWKAETLDDAKQMAIDFSKDVA